MTWTSPAFSKGSINRAGDVLASTASTEDELHEAYVILNNWRASHGLPLNTIQMYLRQSAKKFDNERNFIIAQRLKRVPSIIDKIRRFESMKLARMQDIGGCRVIMSNISEVNKLLFHFTENNRSAHEIIRRDDYIATPKASGYRGIHLVFRYHSNTYPYHDGLPVEMQLRTKLQHAWATSVETVDLFRKYALKSSRGPSKWLRFFSLIGTVFANLEKRPIIPGTPVDKIELFNEIDLLTNELNVFNTLTTYRKAITRTAFHSTGKSDYFLITLTPATGELNLKPFRQKDLEAANREYTELEQNSDGKSEVVLVKAGSVESLKLAYPNYFFDTSIFIKRIERYLSTPPSV